MWLWKMRVVLKQPIWTTCSTLWTKVYQKQTDAKLGIEGRCSLLKRPAWTGSQVRTPEVQHMSDVLDLKLEWPNRDCIGQTCSGGGTKRRFLDVVKDEFKLIGVEKTMPRMMAGDWLRPPLKSTAQRQGKECMAFTLPETEPTCCGYCNNVIFQLWLGFEFIFVRTFETPCSVLQHLPSL